MRIRLAVVAVALALSGPAAAQSLMSGIDLTSPAMTEADMTRAEVEARLRGALARGHAVPAGREPLPMQTPCRAIIGQAPLEPISPILIRDNPE